MIRGTSLEVHVIAAIAGSTTAALPYVNKNVCEFMKAILIGFCFAYFLAEDVSTWLQQLTGYKPNIGSVSFLIAHIGNNVSKRLSILIKVATIKGIWK